MRRRDFIKVIAGLAAGWPLVVRAQSPSRKIYRLGILQPGKPPEPLVDDVLQRLKELGYREGHNIAYEYRWAEGTRRTSEVADCCSSASFSLCSSSAILSAASIVGGLRPTFAALRRFNVM